jgi:acetylglutamate kinase
MMELRTPWVVKVGGRELRPGPELDRLAGTLAAAVRGGVPTLLVHGGGDEITERCDALGLPTQRIGGQRVTDAATLELVVEVLAGRINLRLVTALQAAGVPAIGITGVSGRLLTVTPSPGLGFVGTPTRVRAQLLRDLLGDGWTPVIAPLGVGPGGSVHNVNADLAAAAIASSLHSELALLTDVPAVRDAKGASISALRSGQIRALIRDGVARDGMIPKLLAAESALQSGARSVWIGDLEGLPRPGVEPDRGTRIVGRRAAATPLLPELVPGGPQR